MGLTTSTTNLFIIHVMNQLIIVVCFLGANFSFHKEKARAIPEQGEIVSQIFIIISGISGEY